MKKGLVAAVAVYVAFVFSSVVFFTLYFTAPRDVSWISDTENYIKKKNWEPDREYIPLMMTAFFLYENGEDQFFYLYSEHEFESYINSLMDKRVRLLRGSMSKGTMDVILATDKVLELVYRHPSSWGPQNRLGAMRNIQSAYFVLEDKLNLGFEGTIILRERSSFTFSVWDIPKLFLG